MTIERFAELLRVISNPENDGKIIVPAQIHLRGQLGRIADTFGGHKEAADYFEKVAAADDWEATGVLNEHFS